MIVIVDYGVGNVASIINMLDFIGIEAKASSSVQDINNSSHLLLPGVGAFDYAMKRLHQSGLIPSLEKRIFNNNVPVLGICLGMQLLGKSSEEGIESGLGWIDASSHKIKIPLRSMLKVPNNGWQNIIQKKPTSLFNSTNEKERYYFNHSYHVKCNNNADIIATIQYGEELCCAVQHENIFGVQFHPEKSHRFGIQLLSNFVKNSNA